MLYTLTTNPAVDLNVTAGNVIPGAVNRTTDALFTANGKGLNVSFVLRRFGVPSGILGFFGGFTGEYIVGQCQKSGYPVRPVWVEGTTRVNFFVNAPAGEYKFVNNGPSVSPENQQDMRNILCSLPDLEYLTINGSAASGQADSFYRQVLNICQDRNVPVILDISSKALKELLRFQPLLIKPNDTELAEIFGLKADSPPSVWESMQQLQQMGAQNILLTLGERGAYFYNGTDLFFCEPKKVKQKSSACAGDGFLAGFLSVWLTAPQQVEKALKRAAATGANIAESDGLGSLDKVEAYEKEIHVKKIMHQEGTVCW